MLNCTSISRDFSNFVYSKFHSLVFIFTMEKVVIILVVLEKNPSRVLAIDKANKAYMWGITLIFVGFVGMI